MAEARKLGAASVLSAIPKDGHIAVLDSSGTLKRAATTLLDAANIVTKDDASKGWTTVGTLSALRPGGIIVVSDNIYKGKPRAYVLSVVLDYPNRPIVRCLSGNPSYIDMRIIREKGIAVTDYRIDLNLDTARTRIAALGLIDPVLVNNAVVPSDADVYEYTSADIMPTNGTSGGGRARLSIRLDRQAGRRAA